MGSIAPLIVVPSVATIENIFLLSFKHLSIFCLRSMISIHPFLSVLIVIKLLLLSPIIRVHFMNDE